MSVSYGDVFDAIARAVKPNNPAVICDGVETSWSAFDRRSNALARALREAGLGVQSKVALYMRNGPDYLMAFAACFKARLAPVNINYRYGAAEVGYLLENADAEAVIFDAAFEPVVRELMGSPNVRLWASARGDCASATSLETICSGDGSPLPVERSPDDIFLLYTGGTTGTPKGVMWPSSALWGALAASRAPEPGAPPPMTVAALEAQIRAGLGRVTFSIPPPFMHGTGLFSAMSVLSRGGTVVCSAASSFDAAATLDAIVRHGCSGLVIVGDAFARPILHALESNPARWDLSHLQSVVSSGMMWSPDVKEAMLTFMPNAALADGLGATEAASIAVSVTTRDVPAVEARFDPADTIVVDPETLRPAAAGEIGVIAKAGDLPLGYYKDPERTARTYVTIDGVRRMVSGDHATVDADGRIRLLGRGNHCINTAGEKVYPEEVEQALKTHPAVVDALVFGVPDERLGQRVVAVVTAEADPADLIAHVRSKLAGYKAPKEIVVANTPRGPNGKADYAAARALHAAAQAESRMTETAS